MSILSFLRSPAKHQTGVYKIVNRRNGFIYIGATTQPMVVRWDQHRRRLRNSTHHNARLQVDWNTYGARMFRFAVVEVVDATQAFSRERDWQRVYYPTGKCYNPDPDILLPWMRPSRVPREGMLNTFKLMRKYGTPREEARAVLKAIGVPLDNNLWAEAAPAADDAPHVTPIVGRATSARFETDADYPYQAPA